MTLILHTLQISPLPPENPRRQQQLRTIRSEISMRPGRATFTSTGSMAVLLQWVPTQGLEGLITALNLQFPGSARSTKFNDVIFEDEGQSYPNSYLNRLVDACGGPLPLLPGQRRAPPTPALGDFLRWLDPVGNVFINLRLDASVLQALGTGGAQWQDTFRPLLSVRPGVFNIVSSGNAAMNVTIGMTIPPM